MNITSKETEHALSTLVSSLYTRPSTDTSDTCVTALKYTEEINMKPTCATPSGVH